MKPNYHARPKALPTFSGRLNAQNAQQDGLAPRSPHHNTRPFTPAQAQIMRGVQNVIALEGRHRGPSGEGFAVIEFDGTLGPGGILVAVLVSFHFTRADADRACKTKRHDA